MNAQALQAMGVKPDALSVPITNGVSRWVLTDIRWVEPSKTLDVFVAGCGWVPWVGLQAFGWKVDAAVAS